MRQVLETLVEKSLESRRRNQAATGRVVCVRRARLQLTKVSVAACSRSDLSHITLARAARQARASMPRDSFNREIDYLRISVIDNCNLRCVYCMPLQGLRFLPRDELLTPAEIELVVRAAVSIGFRKFRLTGGEPTLRA